MAHHTHVSLKDASYVSLSKRKVASGQPLVHESVDRFLGKALWGAEGHARQFLIEQR